MLIGPVYVTLSANVHAGGTRRLTLTTDSIVWIRVNTGKKRVNSRADLKAVIRTLVDNPELRTFCRNKAE